MNSSQEQFQYQIGSQITIGMYLDTYRFQNSASRNVSGSSAYQLSIFERTFEEPILANIEGKKIAFEDDYYYGILTSDFDPETGTQKILCVPKVKFKETIKVGFVILMDLDTGFSKVSYYSRPGKYPFVHALNQALYSMGAVPGKIVLAKLPKSIDKGLLLKVFRGYHIKVTEPRGDSKAMPLVSLLKKKVKNSSWTDLKPQLSDLEELVNSAPTGDMYGSVIQQAFSYRKQFMRPLPAEPFHLVERRKLKAQFNYHVEIEGKYYSIPKEFKGSTVIAVITEQLIEIQTLSGVTICVHDNHWNRNMLYITDLSHMPDPNEIPYKERNGKRFLLWAGHNGEHIEKMCRRFLTQGTCEMQGYVPCMSLIVLSLKYGSPTLDIACRDELELIRVSNDFPEISRIKTRCKQMTSIESEHRDADEPGHIPDTPGISVDHPLDTAGQVRENSDMFWVLPF